MFVSVIIPTRNRCESLRNAIVSLQKLNFPHDRYEIIVIDNNSTDATPRVVEECEQQGKKEIVYRKELRDGLHNARHAGAQIAKGDILAYIDDDVLCDPDWLSELTRPYADPKVACVGGKILPLYETAEPVWAQYFPGFLSILDRANEITVVNDTGLWGCNFSIRKNVLSDVGGFHPDAMPQNLIKCRGDGETGLLNKVIERNFDVVYTPFAVVTHVIPKDRVTTNFFKRRAFIQGISDSYTAIRTNHGVIADEVHFFNTVAAAFWRYASYGKAILTKRSHWVIYDMIARKCRQKGMRYHEIEIANDPRLLEYVLKDDYLNTEPLQ